MFICNIFSTLAKLGFFVCRELTYRCLRAVACLASILLVSRHNSIAIVASVATTSSHSIVGKRSKVATNKRVSQACQPAANILCESGLLDKAEQLMCELPMSMLQILMHSAT